MTVLRRHLDIQHINTHWNRVSMNTIYKRRKKQTESCHLFLCYWCVIVFEPEKLSITAGPVFLGFFALIVANVLTVFLSNTHLRHRWSARPTGSWMQTIHWPFIPALRLQLRQRWKWSTRPSTCRTPATPLLLVHLSLPLFPFLPLSVSLSLFAMLWNCESPPPHSQLSSCFCPSYLPSACVGFWSLLLPVSMLFSQ